MIAVFIVHFLHLAIFSTEKVYKHVLGNLLGNFTFIPVLQCFNHLMTALTINQVYMYIENSLHTNKPFRSASLTLSITNMSSIKLCC